MELTSNEKDVLAGLSFNAEEIKKGELNEADMAMLLEMRAVYSYLEEKYPSYKFEISSCDPKSGTVKEYDEWYFRAEKIDRASAFIALVTEDGESFDIKDDFYGEIVRGSIQDFLGEKLGSNDIPVIQINAGFWEYLGKEYGEKILAEDVLKGKIPAGNDIKIFLDGSGMDASSYGDVVKKITEILKKEDVLGEIYIVVLKDKDSDFAKDRLYSKSITLE